MELFNSNNQAIVHEFKERGDNVPVSVRDFAGWLLCAGVLLAVGAWKLGWVENLLTGIFSLVLLAGFVVALAAYPISQIIHRKEDKPTTLYALAQKEMKKRN